MKIYHGGTHPRKPTPGFPGTPGTEHGEKQMGRRLTQMSADLNHITNAVVDQRLSALISGKMFWFSPRLRVSAVKRA